MDWLNPINYEIDYSLFASQTTFELAYDEDCVKEHVFVRKCFKVYVRYNGNPLAFDGCPVGCSFYEFKNYMDTIWYKGHSSGDLDAACTPPTHSAVFLQ